MWMLRAGARRGTVLRDDASRPALVRATPSTRALVTGQIPAGAVVEIVAEERGEAVVSGNARWLRVRWMELDGYLFSGLVGE